MGVKRIIQISALGADESAISPYHQTKHKADQCLQALDLDWIILKPSVVYGPGSASMNFFKAMASLPIISLIDSGQQCIQPIHIDDLVKATLQLVSQDKTANKSINMVGPTAITMKDLYSVLRNWLGKPRPRFFSIPAWFAIVTAELLGRLSSAPLSADAIRMLNRGNIAEIQPFIDEFGYQSKSVKQAFNDTPAIQADRWYAELYLLNPLLRFAIAFVWIYTGIISAFFYPLENSYQMLSRVGISADWQAVTLYTASGLNILLGITILFSYRIVLLGMVQLLIITIYTVLISLFLPEYWLHPFGPLSKNIPLIVSILIMITLAKR